MPNVTQKRYYINPLIILFVGVAFNVLSVVFMHVVARDVEREVDLLQTGEMQIQRQIDGLWSSAVRAENALNTALVLWQSNRSQARTYLEKSQAFVGEMPATISPDSILVQLEVQRKDYIGRINEAYGEKLLMEQERQELAAYHDSLNNIGLFLHMIGIIVILLVDVNRRYV